MFAELRRAWSRLRKQADWRAISDGSRPELEYDVVILSQGGSGGGTTPRLRVYDIYVRGQIVATRPGLAVAQKWVEDNYGPGEWTRRKTDPVSAHHYYFGETEEFAPTVYYTRELA